MFKIMSRKMLDAMEQQILTMQAEIDRLQKVRPIADALRDKGIDAEMIKSGAVHLRKKPTKKG